MPTNDGEQVLVKVACGISYAAAEQRLRNEDPGWNFDGVKRAAESAWAGKLNQVEVKGGTEKASTQSSSDDTLVSAVSMGAR
jgi:putative alpha-1,2-mannosidase